MPKLFHYVNCRERFLCLCLYLYLWLKKVICEILFSLVDGVNPQATYN